MTYKEILEKCGYKNSFGGIYLGDCVEGMKLMDDNSVDISFTSPPYNDFGSASVDISKDGSAHRKYLTVEQFKGDQEGYFNWQCNVIDEMLRVSRKYVLYNIQGIKNNRKSLYKIIGRYADRIHDILIWYKPNGQPCGNKHKISNSHEYILIMKCDGVEGVSVNSDFFRNVIVECGNPNKYANIHRAVMSKNIADKIIGEFSQEGDIVLDPFMGMGTTALCCMEQNKKFIGFEICDTYLKASGERLNEFLNKEEVDEEFLD